MNQSPDFLKPSYDNLTTDFVDHLSPKDAETVAIHMLAQSARMKEHGTILSWSEFNENPDLLVNRLLAKIIVGQFDRDPLQQITAENVAVLSIENSASYLAQELAIEVERSFKYSKPPRIIRARKLPRGESASPAMSEHKITVDVKPITAKDETRTLVASLPEDDTSLQQVKTIIVVDDFMATRSTLNGGIQMAVDLFSQFSDPHELLIIPTAALGKPEQARYKEARSGQAKIWNIITALDVHFGPSEDGGAYIQANGFGKLRMRRASAADFNRHTPDPEDSVSDKHPDQPSDPDDYLKREV
jgi:adenine/guanine phosphoribosyltransferase-like PRPP-binding protein